VEKYKKTLYTYNSLKHIKTIIYSFLWCVCHGKRERIDL